MAYQAENIAASIVTILKAAGTDAGTAVHRGRTLPIEVAENSGDAINVYDGDETSNVNIRSTEYMKVRELRIYVELYKRTLPTDQNDPTSIDTALNDFARKVEVALEADPTLAGTCLWFEHDGTQRDRADADREYGELTLNLMVHYRTQRTNPAVQV